FSPCFASSALKSPCSSSEPFSAQQLLGWPGVRRLLQMKRWRWNGGGIGERMIRRAQSASTFLRKAPLTLTLRQAQEKGERGVLCSGLKPPHLSTGGTPRA